ncbi:MAG: hypothetical protein CM15mP73_1040 [Hyphomicrobiales bacterium]|nr:MAG: hypothetical protein CM15mP73_1040 [Hyphomicrobiales bacterium]
MDKWAGNISWSCNERFPKLLYYHWSWQSIGPDKYDPTIEQHVDWIADCIRYIKKKSYHSIEAKRDAEIEWGKYNDKCARDTLRYYCDSWYLGSNVTGKKRVFYPFVGGLPVYIEKCEKIVNNL